MVEETLLREQSVKLLYEFLTFKMLLSKWQPRQPPVYEDQNDKNSITACWALSTSTENRMSAPSLNLNYFIRLKGATAFIAALSCEQEVRGATASPCGTYEASQSL